MYVKLNVRRMLGIGCLVAYLSTLAIQASADDQPDISKELKSGHLTAAQESLTKYIANHPKNELAHRVA
jgi:hypothetical protein